MVDQLAEFWSYEFVRHALAAASLSAVLGATVGYFVILRNVGFAAHALGHIGFTGATGAALFGLSPLMGMLLITCGAGAIMGVTGNKIHRSELAVGMVLSLSLGLGTLFLALYKGFAGQATAILFGNIFGVSSEQIYQIGLLAGLSLAGLALLARPLLFASVQPDLAEARGIPLTLLSTGFLVLLAVSVTLASQVVGILLVFTLVIGPAGISSRLMSGFWSGIACSAVVALLSVWAGIFLACFTNLPPTFWITVLIFVIYVIAEWFSRFFIRAER
jgi:zinc/manganese transport system permease protein